MDNTTTNSEAGKLYQTMPMSEKPDNDGYYLLLDPENIELSSLCYCLEGEWYRDFDDAMDEHHSELDTDGCSWLKPYTPPAAPVREGNDVLDKLKNYIRDELMFTMGNGRQPNEGKNNAYYNVLEAIEQLKTSVPASTERGDLSKAKEICIAFFHYWWNQPGSNTNQGFDQWVATNPKELSAFHASSEQRVEGVSKEDAKKILIDLWESARNSEWKGLINRALNQLGYEKER